MSNSRNGGDSVGRRKSRWSDETKDKACIPRMPHTLTSQQQEAFVLQLQIIEISRQLRDNDLPITHDRERSPSPAPIYDSSGKRVNTRANRARKTLEDTRNQLIQRMVTINPSFKPPSYYKPPANHHRKKVPVPQDEYPHINFIGLLLGPRGSSMKAIEEKTGAKVIIRGKGSTSKLKVALMSESDEPLHALIIADNDEAVANAAKLIEEVIKKGIEEPNHLNQLRKEQLHTLAHLNGTFRPRSDFGLSKERSFSGNNVRSIVCSTCGGNGHVTNDCKFKGSSRENFASSNDNRKFDELHATLLAEIGEDPPASGSRQSVGKVQKSRKDIPRFGKYPKTSNFPSVSGTQANGNVGTRAVHRQPSSQAIQPSLPVLPENNFSHPLYYFQPYTAGTIWPGTAGMAPETSPYQYPQFYPPSQGYVYPSPTQYSYYTDVPSTEQTHENGNFYNLVWWPTADPAMYEYFYPQSALMDLPDDQRKDETNA